MFFKKKWMVIWVWCFVSKLSFSHVHNGFIISPANSSTSNQPCLNVVNIEITLTPRWKWNKIRRRIFNVAPHWYNISARRWSKVKTTLHKVETTLHNIGKSLYQRCFNAASILVKGILSPVGLVMIIDL